MRNDIDSRQAGKPCHNKSVLLHGFLFVLVQRLNIQYICNFRKVDQQVFIDIDLDNGVKRILNAYNIILKVIYGNSFFLGSTIQYSLTPAFL